MYRNRWSKHLFWRSKPKSRRICWTHRPICSDGWVVLLHSNVAHNHMFRHHNHGEGYFRTPHVDADPTRFKSTRGGAASLVSLSAPGEAPLMPELRVEGSWGSVCRQTHRPSYPAWELLNFKTCENCSRRASIAHEHLLWLCYPPQVALRPHRVL